MNPMRSDVGIVVILSVALLLWGCGVLPNAVPSTPAPAIAHAMEVREQNGLRSDRDWVEAIEVDPLSLERLGIKVSGSEAAAIDQRILAKQIEQRTALHMRADVEWVKQVIADPSSIQHGGLIVTREEAGQLELASRNASNVAPVLAAYGKQHRDEWAGIYLVPGGIVAQVSGHLDEHRSAIDQLFVGTNVHVDVEQVRWSTRQLEMYTKRFWTAAAFRWFKSHHVELESAGASEKLNKVNLEITVLGIRPGTEQWIRSHFQTGEWLAMTVYHDLSIGLGTGTLTVTAVDHAGNPITDGFCSLHSDIPGVVTDWTGDRDLDRHGVCAWTAPMPLPKATTYRVEVWKQYEEGFIGKGTVTVPKNGHGSLVIKAGH
jgi:hypothetical protein